MSVRAIRLSAAFILAGLAFGAAPTAPALADGIVARPTWHHPRHVVRERVRVVRQVVYVPQYVATSCGGCGSAYAAPQYYTAGTYIPYRHIAPQPYYNGTSCGGCGYGVEQTRYSHSGYTGVPDYAPAYAPAYAPDYAPYYAPRYHRGYYGVRPGVRYSNRYGQRWSGQRFSGNRSFYGRRAGGFRY